MDFQDAKEEIRKRLNLVEVIGQYVRLQRRGQRYVGLCPFHQDTDPSFSVDPERGFWHCFGCGEGGDLFAFVMRQEGVEFGEALRMLARRAGVELSSDPQAEARRRRREQLERANRIACEHFVHNLFKHPAAEHARNYLRRRGFNKWAVQTFQLGYALDTWDDLLNKLAAEGINAALAQEAGLIKVGEHGGHYDIFRDRIMFPISDISGRIIAFGGRALDPDNPAKYMNSPETPLFHKRRSLYALDLARESISRERLAIIVEGYTDVISLHQAGIRNVVAGLGTALSREQLDLLGRYAEEVVLVYDADAAGRRAASRNIDVFEGAAVTVSLVVLQEGEDPDEFVRTHGPEEFRELLENRISPIEYQLQLIFDDPAYRGPEGASRAAQAAVEVLLKIPDWTRRDEFVRRAAALWGRNHPERVESMQRVLKFEISQRLRERRGSTSRTSRDPSLITKTLTRSPSGLLKGETELLAEAFDRPEVAKLVLEALEPEDMLTEADAAILAAMKEQFTRDGKLDARALVESLPEEGGVKQRGVELAVTQVRRVSAESADDIAAQVELTICRLKAHRAAAGEMPLGVRAEKVLAELGLTIEDYRSLKRQVDEALNNGSLSLDHPLLRQFREISAALHGRGGEGFVGENRARAAGTAATADIGSGNAGKKDDAKLTTKDDLGGRRVSEDMAPADDPWAIEEGDPFSEDD